MEKSPPPPTRPPPKPKGEGGLDEVERALSILDGRHPEHVRVKREQDAVLAKKRAELDGDHVKEHKSKLARGLVLGLVLGGLVAGGLSIYARRGQAHAIDAALEPLAAPFLAAGFSLVRTADGKLEESGEPGCFVVVAPAPGPIEVEHGGESLSGEGSVGWCACNGEHVTVTRTGPAGTSISPIRLLRVDGHVVGGLDGMATRDPRPATMGTHREECQNELFDAWIEAKHYTPLPKIEGAEGADGAAPLGAPARSAGATAQTSAEPLRAVGFVAVAGMPAGRAFTVVEPQDETCHVAFGRAADDALSLRVPGGEHPIKGVRGPIAWCDTGTHPFTVWREGNGEVVVMSAPARRLGGISGLVDKLSRAHFSKIEATWISPEDLGWDAAEMLRGIGVTETTLTLGGTVTEPKSTPDGRLVALSSRGGGTFASPRADVVCDPKFGAGAICAQMAPQVYRQQGASGAVAVAQAPLPFWLSVLAPVKDPEVAKSLVALVALARRLRGDGFEPTTLEGVTESASGVEVIGRAGDDAVVAVGLGPKAPYVFPYSDGLGWKLGDDPRVVELAPGERALLSAEREPTVPKEERRTVVFRRSKTR